MIDVALFDVIILVAGPHHPVDVEETLVHDPQILVAELPLGDFRFASVPGRICVIPATDIAASTLTAAADSAVVCVNRDGVVLPHKPTRYVVPLRCFIAV